MTSSIPDNATTNKRKWRSTFSVDQTLVAISVNDCGTTEKQAFMLHRELLCNHSPYFHKAFKGDFRESDEKEIHLPDVTSSTLRLFQSWLYSQVARAEPERSIKRAKVVTAEPQRERDEDTESVQAMRSESEIEDLEAWTLLESSRPPEWIERDEFRLDKKHHFIQHFARLYAFAEVYDTPQLRQDVMTILVELCDFSWKRVAQRDCFKAIGDLYGAIPSNTPICQYLLKRLATHSGFGTWIKPYLESMPPALLVDLILLIGPLKNNQTTLEKAVRNSCNFHGHQSRTEVLDCKKWQRRDGAFYVSFLRVCMSEVYLAEDHTLAMSVQKKASRHKKTSKSSVPSEHLDGQTLVDEGGNDD